MSASAVETARESSAADKGPAVANAAAAVTTTLAPTVAPTTSVLDVRGAAEATGHLVRIADAAVVEADLIKGTALEAAACTAEGP
jgi:hypothetical protein